MSCDMKEEEMLEGEFDEKENTKTRFCNNLK